MTYRKETIFETFSPKLAAEIAEQTRGKHPGELVTIKKKRIPSHERLVQASDSLHKNLTKEEDGEQ